MHNGIQSLLPVCLCVSWTVGTSWNAETHPHHKKQSLLHCKRRDQIVTCDVSCASEFHDTPTVHEVQRWYTQAHTCCANSIQACFFYNYAPRMWWWVDSLALIETCQDTKCNVYWGFSTEVFRIYTAYSFHILKLKWLESVKIRNEFSKSMGWMRKPWYSIPINKVLLYFVMFVPQRIYYSIKKIQLHICGVSLSKMSIHPVYIYCCTSESIQSCSYIHNIWTIIILYMKCLSLVSARK